MSSLIALQCMTQEYNAHYAKAITNVAAHGKPVTEHTLTWAHLVANTIVHGKTKSPFDTTTRTCGRCNGSGMTTFTHVWRGVCFKCNGSGDSAHPYPITK